MLTRLFDDVESSGAYLAEVIYGANDGIVTTFAVVAGVAAVTFLAFVGADWTPLLPYLASVRPLFELSVLTTAVVFFLVGASRTLVTRRSWYRSGTEMLLIGLLAAAVAYGAGAFLADVA